MIHALLAALSVWGHAASPAPSELKARVVSWDVGWRPAAEADWTARVVSETKAAAADGVDVLVFPELFTWGIWAYAPKEAVPAEWVTRRVRESVLPAVKAAARPGMLVSLGTYAHQEKGATHAFNRAAVLVDGTWRFADKLDPTQGETREDPPIAPGSALPLFPFRGGTAAVAVCFSLEKPEVAAALKKEGVQLVLGPSATDDEDGVQRVLRSASARAVELGAAVLVAPLLGTQEEWSSVGSAALFLPAQKGIDSAPRIGPRRTEGIHRDDFVIPWSALLGLRTQPAKPETRPFLAPTPPFVIERPSGG